MKKALRWIGRLAACLLLLLVICALCYRHVTVMILHNLFQPSNRLEEGDWDGGKTYLRIPYADISPEDYVDLYVPEDTENPPLLVMVHGGGFVLGDSQSRQSQLVYQYFRSRGYAVASVNYRLAQEAVFPAAVQDVKACIRYLRANAETYGYSADRIAIMGESAGGYLAAMAAVTSDEEYNDLPFIGEDPSAEPVSASVQVLVDYYGCVELGNMEADWKTERIPAVVRKIANYWASEELLGGFENFESRFVGQNLSQLGEEEQAIYMPAYYVKRNWNPDSDLHVYIAHGDSDLTVPVLQSERFFALLKEQMGEDHVQFQLAKNAGHAGEGMFTEKALSQVLEYMNEYIR